MRKKFLLLTLAVLAVFAAGAATQVVIEQRPRSSKGLSPGVGYGTALPTLANSGFNPVDGELFVLRGGTGLRPDLRIYSDLDSTWRAPDSYNVFREDFDFVVAKYLEEDYTASVLTTAGNNMILLANSPLGVISWVTTSTDGLSAQPEGFAVRGVMTLDSFSDDIDNDGAEFVFGAFGPDTSAGVHSTVWFDEDDDESAYCEIRMTIGDISDTDDLWFGWIVPEAYDAPPASATFDTAAYFTISDLAGDLDIETELNGGGSLNDDAVEVWADGETHTMRVTIDSDAVSFTLNGVAVPQSNAVLNFDATDRAVCLMGYTLVAASDPTITIDYVEIGVAR